MLSFYNPVDWYMLIANDVSKELIPLERDNITILSRFEKYAMNNPDHFGR
ncbi:hypothetical protein ACFX5U_05650 [Sphingobacterium sp. SG20118]